MKAADNIRILGIDPGLATVGFGVVDVLMSGKVLGKVQRFSNPRWGAITTSKDKPDAERLQEIHDDLSTLLVDLKPDVVAIEKIFFFRNQTTMVPVTQARGVIVMLMSVFNLPYAEYTPMQVKLQMTGSGKAKKPEVQEAVAQFLGLDKIPRPDDAADGLALAVCHYHSQRGLALV